MRAGFGIPSLEFATELGSEYSPRGEPRKGDMTWGRQSRGMRRFYRSWAWLGSASIPTRGPRSERRRRRLRSRLEGDRGTRVSGRVDTGLGKSKTRRWRSAKRMHLIHSGNGEKARPCPTPSYFLYLPTAVLFDLQVRRRYCVFIFNSRLPLLRESSKTKPTVL
jgi:hypothetical protein